MSSSDLNVQSIVFLFSFVRSFVRHDIRIAVRPMPGRIPMVAHRLGIGRRRNHHP